MLAVKLHKNKRPNLEKGSFLIPIMKWETDRHLIKRWLRLLNRHNRGGVNDHINFITLLKLPDDLPVFMANDWVDKGILDVTFVPIKDIHDKAKVAISSAQGWMPELILGKALTASSVKWTKDVRVLYKSGKGIGKARDAWE